MHHFHVGWSILVVSVVACGGDPVPVDPQVSQAAQGTCLSGGDCPVGMGCADGLCKEDGECHINPADYSDDCPSGQLCYATGGSFEGICASARPPTNPYCRSDGEGACRSRCYADGSCPTGMTCGNDFCHFDDECTSESDCTPNHLCQPYFDAGFSVCVPDPDPSCVEVEGVCRFPCATSADCPAGGCDGGTCRASNECVSDNDCAADAPVCYPHPNFGGLCGPPRP